jgi:cytochrome b561
MMDVSSRYSGLARAFHWTTAILVACQFVIAWTMPEIGRGSAPVGLIGWHLTIGLVIGFLTVARLAARSVQSSPVAPADNVPLLATAARLTHGLLYVMLILLPLLGWINANARGWKVDLFGVIPLPKIVSQGSPIGRSMGDVHATTAILFLVLIGLHVLGAAYHTFIRKDGTLRRMI